MGPREAKERKSSPALGVSGTFASARAGKISAVSGHRWVAPPERAVDRGAPRASPRPRRGNGIPALDGIRALAVALVLADHGGIPGVPGGFIGVDVFFVLSGFLITSLLLDELGRTGGIDLPGFWVRRARRLLPALIVVVMAVVVLRELFPSEAVAAVRDDAVAAFFWVANWVFVFRRHRLLHPGRPAVAAAAHLVARGGGAVLRRVAAGAGGRRGRARAAHQAPATAGRRCARSGWSSSASPSRGGGIGGRGDA